MGKPPKEQPTEREDTDASLELERTKTDEELAGQRAKIEADADHVVDVARERAEEVLRTARARTDGDAKVAGDPEMERTLRRERSQEDRALAQERATADQRLQAEREQRRRALSFLLRHEREATDERLLVERDRADETLAARDNFLGMVSHDLRTLLGGIALSAAMLAQQASAQGEEGRTALQQVGRIQRFTARMNRLVGDLVDVVSLEAGNLAMEPRPHDAVQLVAEALDAFQPSFAAKNLVLTANIEAGSLLAKFDHERVLQVLANLLSNALKFTDQGQVSLSVAPADSEVCFSVTDSGIGIDPKDAQLIFDRFRQVKTHDRRGLGLGLYISKCIVEAHGGRIWAEAAPGGGTTMRFTLPGV
jgi:signal transduction histidine kinase